MLNFNRIALQLDAPYIKSNNAPVTRAVWSSSNLPNGFTLSNGKLNVVTTATDLPFSYVKDNKNVGVCMEIVELFCRRYGYTPVIHDVDFNARIPGLVSGKFDMCASSMTITEERKENVTFSDPYYDSGLTIIVREGEEAIQSFKDLEGKKVAVQIGTTSSEEVHKIAVAEVKELNTPADCFMELKAMGVDAVVNDRPVNDYYISKSGATGVKELPDRLTSESYGMAMAKNNKELQQKVNDALKKLKDNGEYQKIYEKWFGGMASK